MIGHVNEQIALLSLPYGVSLPLQSDWVVSIAFWYRQRSLRKLLEKSLRKLNRQNEQPGRDRAEGDFKEGREEIVAPLAEPTDVELIRKIATTGGKKYTAGNIDRRKYQRLVALG